VPEAELAELEEGVPKTLETMDKWLNAHAFIATSEMTIADLVVYHLLAQAVMTIAIDLGRYPKLCAWYKLMAAMPENKATEFKIKGASARMNRPKIYGCFLSYNSNPLVGFCRATKVAYDYYELDPMTGEHKADWYKEIHPAGQFPAL
jgi:glutathione S-transferase